MKKLLASDDIDVSVVIPTYNRPELLQRAIISALAQKDVNIEILVCEDGESAIVANIISKFHDKRIKHIVGPHAGRPAVPRNRGIHAAKGEWLAFLDDDDAWFPTKLRQQLDNAAMAGAFAICSNAYRITCSNQIATSYFANRRIPRWLTHNKLICDNLVICSTVCLHRSLFDRTQGFPEHINLKAVEDFALWLRVTSFTPFLYIDKILVCYTDIPTTSIRSSATHNVRKSAIQNFILWGLSRFRCIHGTWNAIKCLALYRYYCGL